MVSFIYYINFVSENEFHLSEGCLRSLEQLCILLIENYPRFHNKFLFLCHKSLLSCMLAFASSPEVLRKFQLCIGMYSYDMGSVLATI